MRKLIVLLLVVLAACGQNPPPKVRVSPDLTRAYPTLEIAAVVALEKAMPLTVDYEFGGYILEKGGVYYISEPITNKSNDSIDYDAVFTKDYKLVGVYHTHPDYPESEVFSTNDINNANNLKVNSYLGVVSQHKIIVFIPGVSNTFNYGSANSLESPIASYGTVVKG